MHPKSFEIISVTDDLNDFVKGIASLHKAAGIDQSSRPGILAALAGRYATIGFIDKAKYYYQEALRLGADSARVYSGLSWTEYCRGDMEKAHNYAKMRYELDSTNLRSIYTYGHMIFKFGHFQEAYRQISKIPDLQSKVITFMGPFDLHNIGYILWQAGKEEEAEYYFNEQIRYCTESIRLNRPYGDWGAHYDLVAIYAFQGDKEKAYTHLEEYDKFFFTKITSQIHHIPNLISI